MKFVKDIYFKVMTLKEKSDIVLENCRDLCSIAKRLGVDYEIKNIIDIKIKCVFLPTMISIFDKGKVQGVNNQYFQLYEETKKLNDYFCDVYNMFESDNEPKQPKTKEANPELEYPEDPFPKEARAYAGEIKQIVPVPRFGRQSPFFDPKKHIGIPRNCDYDPLNAHYQEQNERSNGTKI